MKKKKLSVEIAGLALALTLSNSAQALTLTVVDSLVTTNPFGMGFDGTNIFFSTGVGGNVIHKIDQNAAGMPIIGSPITLTGAGTGALAYDGTHFVSASGGNINYFNADGTFASTVTTPAGGGLIDGLDFDHGEVWYSPDVSAVYRLDPVTGAFIGPNPVLPSAGGFSGVERVDIGANGFLIVVNDATSPRQLCTTSLSGVFNPVSDCATLANDRYEDLAFDGRYLYAADLFGSRIDKIDLGNSGGSIFVPGGQVPEPSTIALLGLGFLGFHMARKPKNNS